MKWYLAQLVMEITISGDRRNVVHRNLFLIRAKSPALAYGKAVRLGRKSETSYKNPTEQIVQHKFCGIAELEVLSEELEDEAELRFDEYIGIHPSEIQQWIPPKRRLQVFRKNRVFPKKGVPDYTAKYVLEMISGSQENQRGKSKKNQRKNQRGRSKLK